MENITMQKNSPLKYLIFPKSFKSPLFRTDILWTFTDISVFFLNFRGFFIFLSFQAFIFIHFTTFLLSIS